MKTITRILAAAVILGCAALGSAGPASADQVMEGVYTYNEPGQPIATWNLYPTCVPVVGDLREPLYLPVACTVHVGSSTLNKTTHELEMQNYSADARLTSGLWTTTVNKPEGVVCPDGHLEKSIDIYAFDDGTLTGTHTFTHGAVCGVPATVTKAPFTLTYVEPLPVPVERYPLVCEPAGLRICT
jgi:hypothetical protein